jgi:diguanylate cyclase (GGDEF)-like protein
MELCSTAQLGQVRGMSDSEQRKTFKVLVIEQSQDSTKPWFEGLSGGENDGLFEARQAGSLSKAFNLLESEPFHVILLDLCLPDSQGLSAFSQLYARVPDVPILITSPQEDSQLALEVLREGAQDYLVKGETNPALLRRTILYAIERNRNRAMLQQLSYNDELTGLLNRRGFLSMASQHLKIAQRESWQVVLLFADLDRLKNINDSFGHLEGDRALRAVASILKETFRTSDVIARIGGDEFIVLAIHAPEAGVQKMISRLQQNIGRFNQHNRYYQISLSYGVAKCDPNSMVSLEEMILQADQALYDQKRNRGPVSAG